MFIRRYSTSTSAGAMTEALAPGAMGGRSIFSARQPLWRSRPPGALPLAGTLPSSFTVAGSLVSILVKRSFHAVDHRGQAQITIQRIAALIVQVPNGGADLIVRISGDVLHQEIDQAGVALQDAKNLQRSVGGAVPAERLAGFGAAAGWGLAWLVKPKRLCNLTRKFAGKQDREETAESEYDPDSKCASRLRIHCGYTWGRSAAAEDGGSVAQYQRGCFDVPGSERRRKAVGAEAAGVCGRSERAGAGAAPGRRSGCLSRWRERCMRRWMCSWCASWACPAIANWRWAPSLAEGVRVLNPEVIRRWEFPRAVIESAVAAGNAGIGAPAAGLSRRCRRFRVGGPHGDRGGRWVGHRIHDACGGPSAAAEQSGAHHRGGAGGGGRNRPRACGQKLTKWFAWTCPKCFTL